MPSKKQQQRRKENKKNQNPNPSPAQKVPDNDTKPNESDEEEPIDEEQEQDVNQKNDKDEKEEENGEENGEEKEEKEEEEEDGEKEVDMVKLEKNLRKLLRAKKITREEFEKRMGIFEEKVPEKTQEEMEKELKAIGNESALVGLVEKKGAVDSQSKDIKVPSFTLSYKSNMLLQDAELTVVNGRKYGIIGPNGHGKSTLLRHISQRHLPIPEHINLLHVEQEIEGTDQLAIDAVVEADAERLALLKELAELQPKTDDNSEEGLAAHERVIDIHKRLRAIGAHSAEARASAILAGLQFTPEMQKKKTREFSGGWRMRISLARALFVLPDLLLLDEPTNHLDLDAVIWLEAYLKRYKKTLLLVSHDRDFLNGVVTDIICVKDKKLVYYKGNYDSYEKGELLKKKQKDKQVKIQDKKMKKLDDKQTSQNIKQKKDIVKKGQIIEKEKEYSVKFIFRDPGPLGYPVIQVRKVSFGYTGGPENYLFRDIELNIDCSSRIAIVGPNGTGKSTLMNLILGDLQPTEGEILRNRNLRVAKFSQHFVDQLNMVDTPVDYIAKKFPEFKLQEVRNKLGMYNLKGELHNQPISLLSGGQKSRVAMTEIALRNPHIFFLDEPTNHLDIQTVDALATALQEFKGGVVFITHDQRLVSTVANELWVCSGDGNVHTFEGSFDDYKQHIVDNMPDELFLVSDDEDEPQTEKPAKGNEKKQPEKKQPEKKAKK